MNHTNAIGGFPTILSDFLCVIVIMVERMAAQLMLEPIPAAADQYEYQHPATPQLKRASIPPDRVENVHTQHEQGDADDALHQRVDPLGQDRAKPDREQA